MLLKIEHFKSHVCFPLAREHSYCKQYISHLYQHAITTRIEIRQT